MKKIVIKSIKNNAFPADEKIRIVGYKKGIVSHCVKEMLRLGKGGNILIRPKLSSRAC